VLHLTDRDVQQDAERARAHRGETERRDEAAQVGFHSVLVRAAAVLLHLSNPWFRLALVKGSIVKDGTPKITIDAGGTALR